MNARILFAIVIALVAGWPFHAAAQALNASPGAWEMSVTTLTTGNPIPPAVLAKMPPDERAQIEAAMKARSGKPDTQVFKSCITQNDLDQNNMIKSEGDSNCSKKIVSKSATKIVVDQICPVPLASTGRATIEARTPESIVAVIDTAQGAGGKVHVDVKGRWLGASCEGIEP